MMRRYKRVVCADGFSMSVQASETNYCSPRADNAEAYIEVEVGFPNEKEELLLPWAESPERPTDTVYGYVPVSTVFLVISKHRGMVSGEVPAGVPHFYAHGYKK